MHVIIPLDDWRQDAGNPQFEPWSWEPSPSSFMSAACASTGDADGHLEGSAITAGQRIVSEVSI
jgi:hypothetical protein